MTESFIEIQIGEKKQMELEFIDRLFATRENFIMIICTLMTIVTPFYAISKDLDFITVFPFLAVFLVISFIAGFWRDRDE